MKDWKSAPDSDIVCYCKEVNKGTITYAIANGNNSLESIREATEACTGGNCRELNPSGRCCSVDIIELLKIYGDVSRSDNSCCSD